MKLSDILRTALQNLGRRKVRTVLTSIGVFVGILTIVTMVSLGVGIQRQITDTIKQLGLETVFMNPRLESQPAGSFNPYVRNRPQVPLNDDAVKRIAAIPGVDSVEVSLDLPAAPEMSASIDGKAFAIALVEENPRDRIFSSQQPMVAGKLLENTPGATGIVFSQRLLKGAGYTPEQFGSLIGKPASITVTAPRGDKTTINTTVRGISGTFYGAQLANSEKLEIKKWWFNDPNILQEDGYGSGVVHTKSLGDASRVSKAISDLGFNSATLQTFLDQVNRIFAVLQVMLSSVGLLALLVASIGIVNTMIMAIYERTREIGILKAVGSSNGDVLRMFMVEAGLIGLLGGVVGVLLGWLLGLVLNRIIVDYLKREQIPIDAPFFVVTPELVLGALLFASLVGIAAGLYPAFRAARLDPLTALRHE